VDIWHGYLLSGTGSNEYTRALARTLARQGHDVTVFCQDPNAAEHDMGGTKVVLPTLPGRLPVFVLDKYAGQDPCLLPEMSRAELDAYVDANAAALREAGPADLVIANHVLMGAPVAAASGMPYVVKAHGSELEYAMRGRPHLCAWAAETLADAKAVAVGSEHTARIVTELTGVTQDQMIIAPPGVDTADMRPLPRDRAMTELVEECRNDPPRISERDPDPDNAQRLAAFLSQDKPTIVYVGKLIDQKGVDVLLDACQGLRARVIVVGFGPQRQALEQQARDLNLDALFTGPLQHRHLRYLWPLADVSVVPSVFPEAFGMVAAEAASTGCPPLVARHSGLAEVAAGLEAYLPEDLRILTFDSGDSDSLRTQLDHLLALTAQQRQTLSAGCRQAVQDLWSWDHVAAELLKSATSP
jgi:glycosyltransferase involved in cell wall biosynthesis